jgi:REP element-mobilizing transposase RayT
MARKPRIEFPGALYHVIARGNNQENIFKENKDYLKYSNLLEKYQDRTSFHFYAFVLMPNHIHLLLETEDTPLSKIMQRIQQSYTQYFNHKHNRGGHLFQGRYKAILCEKDSYLLELVRYIHLNPVRLKIVDSPEKYLWSSHLVYLGKKEIKFVETDKVLQMFSRNRRQAQKLYQEFVLAGKDIGHRKEFYEIKGQVCLGEEEFVERIKERINTTQESEKNSNLDDLMKSIFNLTQISEESIKSPTREKRIAKARSLFIYTAIRHMGYSCKEVARFLRKDPSAITHTLNRMEERIVNDTALIDELDEITFSMRRLSLC